MQKDPARPKHPERICWGCDNYCPAGDLRCGTRVPHPREDEPAESSMVPGAGLEPALALPEKGF